MDGPASLFVLVSPALRADRNLGPAVTIRQQQRRKPAKRGEAEQQGQDADAAASDNRSGGADRGGVGNRRRGGRIDVRTDAAGSIGLGRGAGSRRSRNGIAQRLARRAGGRAYRNSRADVSDRGSADSRRCRAATSRATLQKFATSLERPEVMRIIVRRANGTGKTLHP